MLAGPCRTMVGAPPRRLAEGGCALVDVTFYGVRGSTPCPCEPNRCYGGNTACVVLSAPGCEPIVFDLGTGLRFYGDTIDADSPFEGTALVTHLHWDHVQGLPFFQPILRDGSRFTIYGPRQGQQSLAEAFAGFVRPPYFPVRLAQLMGEIDFHDAPSEPFQIGRASVTCASVPHVGVTFGYRVEVDGVAVVYISDHQQPAVGLDVDPGVIDLCRDADLLIHDAQFTRDELAAKADWGHSTAEYAVEVAARAGVRRIALFHHDPGHDDAAVEAIAEQARAAAVGRVEEVIIAAEGLTVALAPVAATAAAAAQS